MIFGRKSSSSQKNQAWSAGQLAALACTWEVCAPKPGNVHRGADFDDVTVGDFLTSALAIAPWIDQSDEISLGEAVLGCVQATRQAVNTNTNLGMILLLVPLAQAGTRHAGDLRRGVPKILGQLDEDDSRLVYQAINQAQPGGLGDSDALDVRSEAPKDLLEAMQVAKEWDQIALEYCTNFENVLKIIAPNVVQHCKSGLSLSQAIVHEHLSSLARWGDSLIARKCGAEVNEQTRARAGFVLESGRPGEESYYQAVSEFDFWLRSDGRKRNPGTTADLICAGLFAALLQGHLKPQRWL